MRGGRLKYPYFLCEWDSRADDLHFTNYEWPKREEFTVGSPCVDNQPLVSPSKIILPALHIKLGLVSNLIKALVKYNEKATEYLKKTVFPKLSAAKIDGGVYKSNFKKNNKQKFIIKNSN